MIPETTTHAYGHGELWLADAVAGSFPTSFPLSLSDIDNLELTHAADNIEHVNKQGPIAEKDFKATRMVTKTGKITCAQDDIDMLVLYLYATKATVAGGSVSATAFDKNPAAVGDTLPLPGRKTKASSLIITDSAGSPATLVLGTDYYADADAGMVKILNLGSYTQPFKAAYTEAAGFSLDLFTTAPPIKAMRFKQINVANNAAVRVLDFPKIFISPAASWALINDGNDVNKYEIDFEVLKDAAATTFQVGKWRQ
jgi:hypothetical protein